MQLSFPAARMAFLLLGTSLSVPVAHAVGTAAGSDITNTASASFTDPDGNPRTVNSNTAALQVDEILDVTLVANDAGNVEVATPDSDRVLSFTLTNTGNGTEKFVLGVVSNLAGDDFDPGNVRIYLDDGDGLFDSASDIAYVAATNDPELAADATLLVFVVGDIPVTLANGDLGNVRLLAEAVTAQASAGADAPGAAFAGAGDNGSDAVVGGNQADADAQNGYAVAKVAATLSKSQAVVNDAVYGTSAVPGATVTYTLTFNVTGVGDISDTLISDSIPAGSSYVGGSLTLDGNPLSDAADTDAGFFNGSGIAVDLDTVTAPATHTVTFQVTID